jgi:hypothetical protein
MDTRIARNFQQNFACKTAVIKTKSHAAPVYSLLIMIGEKVKKVKKCGGCALFWGVAGADAKNACVPAEGAGIFKGRCAMASKWQKKAKPFRPLGQC